VASRGNPEFAVIGLGRFGSAVALTLVERGYSVLGIDRDPALVQTLADQLTQTVALDATDDNALHDIDIASFDTVIVSMGHHFENAVLITAALKALGVATVITKALTERQRAILLKVGADRVVLPEIEAGTRLAFDLTATEMFSSVLLGPDHSITEVRLPPTWIGRTVAEVDLRRRHQVTLLAVRHDHTVTVSLPSDYRFAEEDRLVVLGANQALARLIEPRQ
jgi:trk system potassium uptake protein TrkA